MKKGSPSIRRSGKTHHKRPPGRRKKPLPQAILRVPPDDPNGENRIKRIMRSPTYRRADMDPDFLQRDELRPARLMLEFLKPELGLTEHGIESTIVVFGGTRIMEPAIAKRNLMKAKADLEKNPKNLESKRKVSVAERLMAKAHYYEVAREFSHLVSRTCQTSGKYEFVVVTGGGPGIMEAANRGASDVDAKTVGLSIALPLEQYPNPYIPSDLCFQFRYFALRKMHFLKRAKALVAFPGGYGTLDELFETLTLIQTRTVEPMPVVLVGEEFWKGTFDADYLVSEGVIDPEDAHLFAFAETAEEIWNHIVKWHREERTES
ncbi:MAG: cytochrome D ubiquinol oxidase subunit II [Candidatus Latescibacteria bacterium]|nr:cytochrome D ubiquinol oxidase subunit II [Candidatus Latescibacterota bacterium]NIM22493.1 cytochrome D ubiquinol oxidase subunit II [Candidatus Latescibacterota bacterium]NIM64807.1 cytochrome D ubiquinol oxidase subunit II [Candidatus Latescibacterota bacterium]NIO01315.1 cytochrome D ubiquinol oxidase subunit II [Candidatus Latescibacterota bacterium]NIO27804.1 cytochrome D ubiquinol oxidase subunit II [Candidatus Latescibacterota bacterium]